MSKEIIAVMNLGQEFGTLDGVVTKNNVIRSLCYKALKQGKAKLLVDTEATLSYRIIN